MLRAVIVAVLLMFGPVCFAAEGEGVAGKDVDELVEIFNPPQFTSGERVRDVPLENVFTTPASDIADDVQENAWFSFLVFLPFLVLPQVLLLVVIFRFRDRKDGRPSATFVHNNKLEIAWTAIPVFALLIVSVPVTLLLKKMDLPPKEMIRSDMLEVECVGKQFQWIWRYPKHGIELSVDAGEQLPMVILQDRLTQLYFTSEDVNHAWSVPAFGVKKDAFRDRWTSAWFTPNRSGVFEGQCYELCGEGHGRMLFDTIVVEEEETFRQWVVIQQRKATALDVVSALRDTDFSDPAAEGDEADVKIADAIDSYLEEGTDRRSLVALRYWVARDYFKAADDFLAKGERKKYESMAAIGQRQRARLDALIEAALARGAAQVSEAADAEEEG